MRKIGVQTAPMAQKYGIDKAFEMIKEAGFDAVDFNLDVYYTWPDIKTALPCEQLTNRDKIEELISQINTASEKHGIVVNQMHAVFPSYFDDHPDYTENVYNTLVSSIEICHRVGCKLLVIHPGFGGYNATPEMKHREWEINIKIYSSLIPYLDKWGVTCLLENMWVQDNKTKKIYGGICADIREANDYIDELNKIAGKELFGFCFDIGHALIVGYDPYIAIKLLGKRMKTMHIHDNDGNNDSHVCPYMGIGDWERFILALKETGYDGCLNFETSGTQNSAFRPEALWPASLRLTAEVGRYFAKRLDENEER